MTRILIADDNACMRQMLRQTVAGLASAVDEASDGAEAVRLYTAHQPDWVLMDLRMEPMNGLQATAQILGCFPEARIIIVSQYDDPELRAEAARAGACAYVLKENLDQLTAILSGAATSPQNHTSRKRSETPSEPV